MTIQRAVPILLTIWAVACGDETVELGSRSDSPAGPEAPEPPHDATATATPTGTIDVQPDAGDRAGSTTLPEDDGIIGCSDGGPQCNNCIDDDGDGWTDGFDPQCLSSIDTDETRFISRYPGDRRLPIKQDCFFDDNNHSSDDGCALPICCTLGDGSSCLGAGDQADPCRLTQQCLDTCAPRVLPGCDCFGCCTVCAGDTCADVLLHPRAAWSCTTETLDDTNLCPRCTKSPQCAVECDPEQCILCPGQTIRDLPSHCRAQQCPKGLRACADGTRCDAGQYCANGCCVAVAG